MTKRTLPSSATSTVMAVAALFLAGFAMSACGDSESEGDRLVKRINRAIVDAAATKPRSVVSLEDLVDFEWDRLEISSYSDSEPHHWEFRRRGETVLQATGYPEANPVCLEVEGVITPRRARFYVKEFRYRDGSLYRLMIPAGRGGVHSRAARRCVASNGP